MYSRRKPPCQFCVQAKSMLDYYGVEYEEKLLDDINNLIEFKDNYPNIKQVDEFNRCTCSVRESDYWKLLTTTIVLMIIGFNMRATKSTLVARTYVQQTQPSNCTDASTPRAVWSQIHPQRANSQLMQKYKALTRTHCLNCLRTFKLTRNIQWWRRLH